jgi:hypothetical protein
VVPKVIAIYKAPHNYSDRQKAEFWKEDLSYMPWYLEVAREYMFSIPFWETTPSYLDMDWIKIEKHIWDMIHRPPQMLQVQSDPTAAGVAATPPMGTPTDAGNQIIRTPSPTRLVVSDVAVADLGMGALGDTADKNRPKAMNTRLERANAGVAGPGDNLMIVLLEETPTTLLALPQSAPHSDSDVLEHENPPA